MKNLTEESIRPAKLMEKQKIYALVDVGRMLSKCEEFVFVKCPACNKDKHKYKFTKNGMKYVECEDCKTFYVNPRPTSDVLDWFYKSSPNYAYWSDFVFTATEKTRREKIFVPRVEKLIELCAKYKIKTDSLLEIGSGYGTFCSEVKSRNIFNRIVAVEPTPDLAEKCREAGLEVIEETIEKIQFNDDLFDVVVSFEVIEHLFEPSYFVKTAAELLNPGGILMLTCPNGMGFDIETLGVLSDTVDHEHLNYFNPKSLAILMENYDLEVLEVLTPGVLDADLVRNKVLSGELDISDQPFLQKILVNEWDSLGAIFQDFLITHGLSSNMWIVARKIFIHAA